MSETETTRLQPDGAAKMLERAIRALDNGASPDIMLDVAARQAQKWAELVEQQEAGIRLDGRASIYTGETYTQARDRWDTYRGLLVEHLTGPDGGGA